MKTPPFSQLASILCANRTLLGGVAAAAWLISAAATRGDNVQMQNGDRYVATVVSMDSETLVIRNDVLGTVRLPRGKVASISFGQVNAKIPSAELKTNAAVASSFSARTNADPNFNT